ncbi:DUF3102 domain-containing protein [Kolteria novifilia]
MRSLQTAATEINTYHRKALDSAGAVLASAKSVLANAKLAGDALLRAKEQIRHGGWEAWVSQHCEFSCRVAQRYMRIASHWDEFEGLMDIESGHIAADLTIRGFERLLERTIRIGDQIRRSAADLESSEQFIHRRFLDKTPEDRHYSAVRWWDLFASDVLMLDAAGWDVEAIAEAFLVTPETVKKVLEPRIPTRFDSPENGQSLCEGEGLPEIAEQYAALVQRMISTALADAAKRAASVAVYEGFPEAKQRLQATQTTHRANAVSGAMGAFPGVWNDPSDNTAMWTCAWTDMAAALGIDDEPPEHFDRLSDLWASARETILQAA